MTGAESALWEMLRGRRLDGLKFRRQAPVAGFVVDFFCPELELIIELDGGVHRLREGEDALRDERLRVAGFEVLRFDNAAFENNPGVVLSAIREKARQRKEPPQPSASGGHLLPRGEKGAD
jgi:very-short-patch-repair endonuclease